MTRTVFTGGRIFDGTGAPLADGDVVTEGGRIVEVGSGLDGDEGVDCAGKALLPGLFDCHVHLAGRHEDLDEYRVMNEPFSLSFFRMAENLRLTLALGITSVRDASGADAGLRMAVQEGTLAGPRMQISVTMLSMTGGHADAWMPSGTIGVYGVDYPGMPSGLCDGVEGVTRKVREVIRAGADVIKIASSGGFLSPSDDPMQPNFSEEEVAAIVRTAADLGRPVMSHAHGPEGIKRAVRAGVRSIEHGTYLDDEAIGLMLERGTWLVPTLTAGDTTEAMAADPHLPDAIRAKLEGLGRPELDAFRRAAEAGVRVAMGTDCPVAPHGTNLHELELMAGAGLSPEQALVAATSSAAELLGWEDRLGTLEAGKTADLVVVDGDPFDLATLRDRVEQVWKDGARVV
ncbi:MAG TPA: amidohydrolase family protein [Actinomycetota bacterium]|nr:amidohydrolase family protein [Actinomycetota bacterium]